MTQHNLGKGQNPPLVIEKIKSLEPVRQSAEAIKENSKKIADSYHLGYILAATSL
jgi:hypothetical protein